jgi:hypothetical protein
MGTGGPVWHVSTAGHQPDVTQAEVRAAAYAILDGYGDASLGEWEEIGRTAFHLRRRLSAAEQQRVGPVVDIRGTDEAVRRVSRVWRWVRQAGPGAEDVAEEEMTGR